MKVVIPMSASGAGSASSTRRVPKYVSPSLQSVVVQILGSRNQQLVQGNDYVNITGNGSTSNASCTTVSQVTTCTIDLSAAIGNGGTFTIVVATYDAAQTASCTPHGTPACNGNALSITSVPQNITPGQTVAVTLGGIPAYFQGLELLSGYIAGKGNSLNLTLYGPGPQQVLFEFLDADFNAIIGTGTPTVTVTAPNPAVLQGSVTNSGGIYTLTFDPQTTTVGGLQVVQAGAASLGFTLSIPGTSLSAGATLPVTIAHSAVYLVANNGGPLSVYAFFDGNTTPSYTFYNAGTSFLGINTDINGNVWVADSYNNKVPMWSNPQPGTVPGENDGTTTGIAYPQVIAFDISGNAFVGNCGVLQCIGAGPFALDEYYAPAPASTPNFSAVGFQNYSDASHIPYAIAVDINDFIYISRWNDVNGTVDKYQPGNASILATLVTQASPEYGLGLVPGGNLGVLLSSAMIEFVNRTTGTPGATISSGALTSAQGMAVDSLGNAWAPNFSSGGATEWIYPAYSTTKTIGSAAQSGPVSIAVWPNSLIGEDAIVGVPPPQTPMPYPIPTPT